MQMICALLVHQQPELPAPLATLSPWLDWLLVPRDEVYAILAAQHHRRYIKTHTPLDGVPIDPRTTYIVVARHPLDMAVSLYHQGDNLDRDRIRQLTGAPAPAQPAPAQPAPAQPAPAQPAVAAWLRSWIEDDVEPRDALDSLPGVLWHLSDAWGRRHEPNVVLVHYDDLCGDLDGEMRRLAARLGITVPEAMWPRLAEAATFDRMRAGADRFAPDPAGVLKNRGAFFRRGTSGAGRELLSERDLAAYRVRAAALAPPDLLAWLHRDPAR
jgi:hypothetical protein